MTKLTAAAFSTVVLATTLTLAGCGGGEAVDEPTAEGDDSTSAELSTAVTVSTNRYGDHYFPLTPAMSQNVVCYSYCYSSGTKYASSNFFNNAPMTVAAGIASVRATEAQLLKTYPGAVCDLSCESLAFLEGRSPTDGFNWLNFCPGSWSVAACTQYSGY